MAGRKVRRTSRSVSMRRKGIKGLLYSIRHIKAFQILGKALIYFVLICICFVYLEPILEMISKSFMAAKDLVDPSIKWIPKNITLDNFKAAAETLSIANFKKISEEGLAALADNSLFNSIWISGLFALAQTIVSSFTGFALSRYKFKGKSFWFGMIILAFILPIPLLTIPRVIEFSFFGDLIGYNVFNTIIPQFTMAILGQGTYSTILILIFYNFFNMIPTSLDEAAMIDGAGAIKVFYHVAIRLSLSTILVVFMLAFVFNWNEQYQTNTYMKSAFALLPNKLAAFDGELTKNGAADSVNEAYQMAATLISIAPLMVLYALVQKRFIEGIENAGITGE